MAKIKLTWWQKLKDEYVLEVPDDARDDEIEQKVTEFCFSLTEYMEWERIEEKEE